jgi:hypothetical protein
MALPLLTDLATIFIADEFGVSITRYTAGFSASSTFVGIFDNETIPVDAGGYVSVHQEQPRVTCRTSDVSDIKEGDVFVISGVEYTVRHWVHDGTGVTVVGLEKA